MRLRVRLALLLSSFNQSLRFRIRGGDVFVPAPRCDWFTVRVEICDAPNQRDSQPEESDL
jgi:hypothetical protein